MKNLLGTIALAAIMTAGAVQIASAVPITLTATLVGSNEVPPSGSPGTGFATVTIDSVLNTMQVNINFSGLLSTTSAGAPSGTTASHIHCCLASPQLTGVNAGVATTTPTFPGFPLGVTSGTYSQLFDMTLASSYNPSFISGSLVPSHTVSEAEAVLFAGLFNQETYLNIHTNAFPGGEIRGFLIPVPEPITLSLFSAGLAGAIAMRRRLKKKSG